MVLYSMRICLWGPTAPEFCPQCKAPASKFKEVVEGASFATVHEVGVAQGVSEDILKDLELTLRVNVQK